MTNITNDLLEKLLACRSITYTRCSIELQRYRFLTNWAGSYPQFTWSGNSLTTYVDNVILKNASTYKPEFPSKYIYMRMYGEKLYVWPYAPYTIAYFNANSSYYQALTSKLLRIDCYVGQYTTSTKKYFTSIIITFILPNSTPNSMSLTITNFTSLSVANGYFFFVFFLFFELKFVLDRN